MAEEEDFSALPLTERWVHKQWKVRKGAYEEATKAFEISPDEGDPVFRPFLLDTSLMKSAVGDSNVAAQQDGLAALCSFIKFGGREAAVRTRGQTISLIVEKGLTSTRAATKASALEALLLYIEFDVPGPVIEDVLPFLSHKAPKVIAAALAALTAIFHNYGCKTADPKPVLKLLPKVFGHADKNVRAEATSLAVELYRWLREAMKPMFWNDLKPTQQTDLEAQFEKVKAEGPPQQERLLKSQQAVREKVQAGGLGGDADDGVDDVEEVPEIDAFDLAEPQEVLSKVPKDFHENLNSTKWKERKEAVDALYAVLNVPRIKDGDYGEINRGLAKCMKDANIAVVTQAAQCIEVLARGLRHPYARYRSVVMQPLLERLKEKKQSVADALGAALDEVFLATSLSDCLEDITAFLVHKNPQVKEGTMKFLVRCLRTTRDVPSKQEIGTIVESAKKLLSESSEGLRSGGAEILGTTMKIIGERAMTAQLEGLDDIRKAKVKEFYETAEVKAKEKPKPKPQPAPAAKAPTGGPKKAVKKGPGVKKPAPASAPVVPPSPEPTPLPAQPTPRAAPASKLGMPKPSGLGGLRAPQKRTLPGPGASPRRPVAEATPIIEDDSPPPVSSPQPKPVSRLGAGRGGLTARTLSKPTAQAAQPPLSESPTPSSGLTAMERAELEELRAANDALRKQADEWRHERSKLHSEIQELKNQNAGLIEDHTRDVLSIKAKETQLVRARSDVEAAEQTNERLRRELDRLKRALGKAEALNAARPGSPASPTLGGSGGLGMVSPTHDDAGIYRDGGAGYSSSAGMRNRMSFTSTLSEEKENGDGIVAGNGGVPYPRSKLSPELRYAGSSTASSGRGSPARGFRRDIIGGTGAATMDDRIATNTDQNGYGIDNHRSGSRARSRSGSRMGDTVNSSASTVATGAGNGNLEAGWKRAAEVTSQLKARIEQMKARQQRAG